MGKVVKSVVCGYAGAVLAGLIVAVIGVAFGLSEATVAATAASTRTDVSRKRLSGPGVPHWA